MSVPSWARKGARVVFVGHARMHQCHTEHLEIGRIYTVRSIFESVFPSDRRLDAFGVRVSEVSNDAAENGMERGYPLHAFRPAVPPKTLEEDIAQFLPLLKHQNAPEAVE